MGSMELCDLPTPQRLFDEPPDKRLAPAPPTLHAAAPRLVPGALAPPHSVRRYILNGYRPLITDPKGILASLFYCHNESGNIYTHVIAFLLTVGIMVHHYFLLDIVMQPADAAMAALFFAGLLSCYGLSSYYHLQCCNTLKVYNHALGCDLLGIIACILGSFYIGLWVGFLCDPVVRAVYMGLITAAAAPLLCIAARERWRTNARVVVPTFVLVVAGGLVPTVHFIFVAEHPAKTTMVLGICGMFVLYALGTALYLASFPERLAPGRFDLLGNSHQLWHILVFLAPMAEYMAGVAAMKQQIVCPGSSSP